MKGAPDSQGSAGASRGVVIALALAALGALALPAAAAAAPITFAEGLRIGTVGTPRYVQPQGAGKISNPLGLAVDNSCALHSPPLDEATAPTCAEFDPRDGDVYLADGSNYRIDRFDAGGRFELAWGAGVADGKSEALQTCGPATEPEPTKRCFAAPGRELSGAGAMEPVDVAVDPATGDVFVSDWANHRVQKFSPEGEFLLAFGRGVDKTTGGDVCTAASGDECGRGARGEGTGYGLNAPQLAFGPSGDLWVGDRERAKEFGPEGALLEEVELPGAGPIGQLAVGPGGDFYVVIGGPGPSTPPGFNGTEVLPEGEEGVRKYDPSGAPLSPVDIAHHGHGEYFKAIALDAAGDLFVADRPDRNGAAAVIREFDPEGHQVSQFGAGQVAGALGPYGIAIGDAAGALYSDGREPEPPKAVNGEAFFAQLFSLPAPGPLPEGEHVSELLPTSATLAADLNPEGGETTYRFEYDTSPYGECEAGHGASVPVPDTTLPGSEYEAEEVSEHLEGLLPDTTYHFRLVAENEHGVVCGEDTAFATPTAVAIEAQWVSQVSARDATLAARLDPLGPTAQWWVEYGEGGSLDRSTPREPLAAGFGAVAVSAPIAGLSPGAEYSYRFAATDEREGVRYTVHGPPRAFSTQPAGLGFALADERAWEMVSPPDKHGARLELREEGQIQAAANGEALAYLSRGSVEADPAGNRSPEGSSALARRVGAGQWASRDIATPSTVVVEGRVGFGLEYRLFGPDLSAALVEPRDPAPLAPWASERTPYLRTDAEPPTYTPLVVGCPAPPAPCPAQVAAHANVPAGTEFGGGTGSLSAARVKGAGADLAHVVLDSGAPLAAGAPGGALYEWSAAAPAAEQIRALSVLPEGEGGATVSARLGSAPASVRGAISTDASRVFWTAASGGGLYVRDLARGETARLDVVRPGAFGTGLAKPFFQGANAAGTVAFFTDPQNLTEDANEAGADLYRCQVAVEEGELRCDLSDLSAETHNPEDPFESAEVQGLAAGIGEDGESAYFVARGVLDAAANGYGQSAVPGRPNLYAWREGEGIRFIATLSEQDGRDWASNGPGSPLESAGQSAAASPSGRYLAFMSELPLTGYDNRDARSGEADEELFRYDAAANGGEGKLICASCDPSGARPAGRLGALVGGGPPIYDPKKLWIGRPLAATLPEASRLGLEEGAGSLYRPRAVGDDGRLFFNAADALVGADSNGEWDVYEYEPSGTGTCSASAGGAATALAPGGCVSLISSGAGEGESAFLDASEGGGDVFFLTDAQLSVADVDEVTDVYDARVGGTAATREEIAECQGEACQPPYSPPNDPTPASSSFEGPGNLPEEPKASRCPQGKRKVHRHGKVRCVKRHRVHRHGRAHR